LAREGTNLQYKIRKNFWETQEEYSKFKFLFKQEAVSEVKESLKNSINNQRIYTCSLQSEAVEEVRRKYESKA
jgi:hypothetical protein